MKVTICKLRGCPRLVWAETPKGSPDFAECNQHMPDEVVWFEKCVVVSKERCKVLRRTFKQMREVQG